MNIHIPAIDFDKVLKIAVAIIIIVYLIIGLIKNVDLSRVSDGFNIFKDGIKMNEIYNYLEEHDNYYYKIEGSIYCISKEELKSTGEISESFIESMPNNYIEAKYINGQFDINFSDLCIPN